MPQLFPVIICMFYFFLYILNSLVVLFWNCLSKLVNYYAKQEEVKLNKCLFFHILLI